MFNFGFKKVEEGEKMKLVSGVFESVSKKYDLMNNIMSFGLQNLWKKNFMDFIQLKDGGNYLDLASGSGDITLLLLEKAKKEGKEITVTACDASHEMLEVARQRITHGDVRFVECFAEELPFKENEFDGIFISFGIRNFTNLEKALEKLHFVLKKEGSLFCLEFFPDVAKTIGFDKIYKQYLLHVIPFFGKIFVNNAQAYKYFGESILNFYSKKDFKNLLQNSSFRFFSNLNSLFEVAGFFHFKK